MTIAGQVILGFLFSFAAAKKFVSPSSLLESLSEARVPVRVARRLAGGLPVAELGLAVALLLSHGTAILIAFGASALLLSSFTAWMLSVRVRGLEVLCGCFGTGRGRIDARAIARNIVLSSYAGICAVLASSAPPLFASVSVVSVMIITGSLGATALIAAAHEIAPRLTLSAHDFEQLQESGAQT